MGTVKLAPAHTSLQQRSGSESVLELVKHGGKDRPKAMLLGPYINLLRKELNGCLIYILAILFINCGDVRNSQL